MGGRIRLLVVVGITANLIQCEGDDRGSGGFGIWGQMIDGDVVVVMVMGGLLIV
jgi:hypothetical protein